MPQGPEFGDRKPPEMSEKPQGGDAPPMPGPGRQPWGGSLKYSPKLPEPYTTWDPEQACSQFEED